jgi:hypothetical protein
MTEKGVKRRRDLLSDASEFGRFKFCAVSKQNWKGTMLLDMYSTVLKHVVEARH